MLNKNDVTMLRGMFVEVLDDRDVQWKADLDQRFHDFKHEIRDEIHSVVNGAVSASEARMMNRMDGSLERVKVEIIDAIGEILDESVLPQISDLQVDMRRVKNHLQMA